MKSATLLLTTLLLIAGCSTAPSSPGEKVDRLIVPDVVGYTPAEQKQAYEERRKHCSDVPMLCRMINDYGRMRDQARAALGLKVNVER